MKRRSTHRRLTLFVAMFAAMFPLVFLLATPVAFGQNPTGHLDLLVTDSNEARLAGVFVKVTGSSLVGERSTLTKTSGVAQIQFLPPGDYTVELSLEGRGTKKIEFEIGPGSTTTITTELSWDHSGEEFILYDSFPGRNPIAFGGWLSPAQLREPIDFFPNNSFPPRSPTAVLESGPGQVHPALFGEDGQRYPVNPGQFSDLAERGLVDGNQYLVPVINDNRPWVAYGLFDKDGGFVGPTTFQIATFPASFAISIVTEDLDLLIFDRVGKKRVEVFIWNQQGFELKDTLALPTVHVGPEFGGYPPQGDSESQRGFDLDPGSPIPKDRIWLWGSFIEKNRNDLPPRGGCNRIADQVDVRLLGFEGKQLIYDEVAFSVDGRFGTGSCDVLGATNGVHYGETTAFFAPRNGKLYYAGKRFSDDGPPTVWELGDLPASLAGKRFHFGTLGDPGSGSVSWEIPGAHAFEWSEDGQRLGFDPWQLPGPEPPLDTSGKVIPFQRVGEFDEIRRRGPFNLADRSSPSASEVVGAAVAADKPVLASVLEPGCVDLDGHLCLLGNRFAVTAHYSTPEGDEGRGHARQLSDGSGTFWFFTKGNREVIAKVIDACAFGGHYWFFAAGLTNVGVTLEVWDRETGLAKHYQSPVGQSFQPILDTRAVTCLQHAMNSPSRSWFGAATTSGARRVSGPPLSDGTACGGEAGDLCFQKDRFRVEAQWTDAFGNTGAAFGGNLSDESGVLFFTEPTRVELLIKVLDTCSFSNRFWVFAAGTTDLHVVLRVIDTQTGKSKVYTNPASKPFLPINDTNAFATC